MIGIFPFVLSKGLCFFFSLILLFLRVLLFGLRILTQRNEGKRLFLEKATSSTKLHFVQYVELSFLVQKEEEKKKKLYASGSDVKLTLNLEVIN